MSCPKTTNESHTPTGPTSTKNHHRNPPTWTTPALGLAAMVPWEVGWSLYPKVMGERVFDVKKHHIECFAWRKQNTERCFFVFWIFGCDKPRSFFETIFCLFCPSFSTFLPKFWHRTRKTTTRWFQFRNLSFTKAASGVLLGAKNQGLGGLDLPLDLPLPRYPRMLGSKTCTVIDPRGMYRTIGIFTYTSIYHKHQHNSEPSHGWVVGGWNSWKILWLQLRICVGNPNLSNPGVGKSDHGWRCFCLRWLLGILRWAFLFFFCFFPWMMVGEWWCKEVVKFRYIPTFAWDAFDSWRTKMHTKSISFGNQTPWLHLLLPKTNSSFFLPMSRRIQSICHGPLTFLFPLDMMQCRKRTAEEHLPSTSILGSKCSFSIFQGVLHRIHFFV